MRYVSTRGRAPVLDFADTLLAGLATDGGLYVPEALPSLPPLAELVGRPYAEVATRVMFPYVEGSLDVDTFGSLVEAAYASFDHPDVVPVVDLDAGLKMAELFWGPTIAFKDVALQLVGRLFDEVLAGRNSRVTVLGATSGDTGSAAMCGLAGSKYVDVVILYPYGRVSEVQRRQMTTITDANVHAVAVDGTFDDCQDLVKAAFADEPFRNEVSLSAVNSINWARVMAQIVYYATASLAAQPERTRAASEGTLTPIDVVVPTGNFGNIFAGWCAQQTGAPLGELVSASNRNDILDRFFRTGTMTMEPVIPTTSPSMDIGVSSNLERLLFERFGRQGARTEEFLQRFRDTGTVSVTLEELAELRSEFGSGRQDDDQVSETIRRWYERSGVLLDPHTAVGVGVAEERGYHPDRPTVCLATAHAAKFPDAVEAATGVRPPLPTHLANLFELPERTDRLPNNLAVVQDYVRMRRTES